MRCAIISSKWMKNIFVENKVRIRQRKFLSKKGSIGTLGALLVVASIVFMGMYDSIFQDISLGIMETDIVCPEAVKQNEDMDFELKVHSNYFERFQGRAGVVAWQWPIQPGTFEDIDIMPNGFYMENFSIFNTFKDGEWCAYGAVSNASAGIFFPKSEVCCFEVE